MGDVVDGVADGVVAGADDGCVSVDATGTRKDWMMAPRGRKENMAGDVGDDGEA